MWNVKRRIGSFVVFGAVLAAGCRKTTDYWITGVDVVQGVQNPVNGIPLVAYKPTFVRVYVQSNEANHGPWRVSSRLVVKNPTGTQVELMPSTFDPSASITVSPSGSHRDQWGDSFTFWLNYLETAPGMHQLSARIFSGPDVANPPPEHTFTRQQFVFPAVRDSVYGVVWAVMNMNDPFRAPIGPAAPWSDYSAHRAFVENVFPVSGFTVSPVPGIGTVAPNPQTFGNLTDSRTWAAKMAASLPPGSKINLLDNWDTGGLHGYADGAYSEEQNARDGNRVGKTMAQEVAHSDGLPCHTFDPCDAYPHPQGHIDSMDFGFNLSADLGRSDVHLVSFSGENSIDDKQTVAGPLSDIMSYNQPPIWISSYTTCQLIGVLWKNQDADCTFTNSREQKDARVSEKLKVAGNQTARPKSSGARYDRERAFLFAAGVFEETGRVRLADLEMIPSATDISTPPAAGDLKLQLLDAGGATLAEFPIEAHTTHQEYSKPLTFSLVVPFEDQKEKTAKVVVRKGDAVLAEQIVPRAYPRVTMLPLAAPGPGLAGRQTISWTGSDPEGRPLQYSVLYSADDGKTWWPVHVGLKQTKVEIDFDTLPGSEKALLKVRASNGGRSTEATLAAPVRVPRKPPQVSIGQPAEGATLDSRLPQLLRGDAFRWEDGTLADGSSFAWTSDRAGELGNGHWTATRKLLPGPHTITLTVRDAAGQTGTSSVHVTVYGAAEARTQGVQKTP